MIRRWRTVGLVGVMTSDRRLLDGTVTIRGQGEHRGWQTVPLLWGADDAQGHVGSEYREQIAVRVRGNQIQALLPRQYRAATPAFHADVDYLSPPGDEAAPDSLDELVEQTRRVVLIQRDPVLIGLGPGPSAWTELR